MNKYAKFLRACALVLLVISLAVFQASAFPGIWPLKFKPDFLLIAGILFAMTLDFPQDFLFFILCGLLKDVFSINWFGMNTMLFAADGILVLFALRFISKEIPALKFIFAACITILNYLFLTIILKKPYLFIGIIESVLNTAFLYLFIKLSSFIMPPVDNAHQ